MYYTPTGFSTLDVRALGRFPDYAALSGVRLPHPVDAAWDISRAVFRPYRPFRWRYHQHMGTNYPLPQLAMPYFWGADQKQPL